MLSGLGRCRSAKVCVETSSTNRPAAATAHAVATRAIGTRGTREAIQALNAGTSLERMTYARGTYGARNRHCSNASPPTYRQARIIDPSTDASRNLSHRGRTIRLVTSSATSVRESLNHDATYKRPLPDM